MKKIIAIAIAIFQAISITMIAFSATRVHADGAIISTDKADYSPGEIVTVTGSGFNAGESYAVVVLRPDGTIVKGDGTFTPGWDIVQADNEGGFTYLYQLDGIEGLYNVSVYSSSWTLLASTTFTDAKDGANLDISGLTATSHYTKTFAWTIDKSVTPATWNLFEGDSGTSDYTITYTKDSGTLKAWIDGSFVVTNTGELDTTNLAISVSVVVTGGAPADKTIGPDTVNLGSNTVLSANGGSATYSYSIEVTSDIRTGTGVNYKVTISASVDNPKSNNPQTGEITLSNPFSAGPTLVYDSVTITDTNHPAGEPWTVSASGSKTYSETFTAPTDAGPHTNTAAITETGQSDSASVTVNSYALDVSKTATPSWTRTYSWTIDKSADESSLTLSLGGTFTVHYSIKVDATYADTYSVSGTITITNPTPFEAKITAISDVVSTGITASISDNPTFPYALKAGKTLTVHYTASLPDDSSRTNTAKATIQNYDYSSTWIATESGTTDFTGTADIDFTGVTATPVDDSVTVTDSYKGSLGTATAGVDTPKTFTYSRTIGPYNSIGDRTITNTATYTTDDTGATDSDSWTLTVHVIGSAFVGVTSSGFCHITQFKLIFTPDVPVYPGYSRLTASNPGQFYFNVYYMASGSETFTINIPYPFVTQGANPVQIYNSAPNGYVPQGSVINSQFSISGVPITLPAMPTTFGSFATITIENNGYTGPMYITIHLDYGLKKVAGDYGKNTALDALHNTNSAYATILNNQTYAFSVTAPFSDSDSITNVNTFKNDPGIGGLVLDKYGNPVANVKVQIYQGKTLMGTVYTDADGWYMWNYKWTGKAVTFTIKLPAYSLSQDSPLKANGFLVVNFGIT